MSNQPSSYFSGKRLVIIGASFGIGEALAIELAKQQANLVLVGRTAEKLQKLANTCLDQQQSNHQVSIIRADLLDLKSVQTMQHQLDELGNIDCLIVLVGTYEPMGLGNFDLNKSKQILDANFSSILNLLPWIHRRATQRSLQQLVLTASLAGYFGLPNSLVYGASKAALINLSESLHYELNQHQVKVQVINPGFVKTRLTDMNDFTMPFLMTPTKAAQQIIKQLPKRRFEIAFPFLFASFFKLLQKVPGRFRRSLVKQQT